RRLIDHHARRRAGRPRVADRAISANRPAAGAGVDLLPGANGDVVTQSIAAPIEQQVNGAKNMLYMDSKSANDGSYSLIATFDVGTNQDLAAVDVQNRISVAQSSLPADVIRQGVIVRKQSTDFLEVLALTSPDGRLDTT